MNDSGGVRMGPAIWGVTAVLAGFLGAGSMVGEAQESEPPEVFSPSPDVGMQKIADGVWMHTTFQSTRGQSIAANGLIVVAPGGIWFVDTGWHAAQAEKMFRWAEERFEAKVQGAIVTHAHPDRNGGLAFLIDKDRATYGLAKTAELAEEQDSPVPALTLDGESPQVLADGAIEVFYPGAGHAPDNVVVWLPKAKLVFGGCLIKSAAAQSLGYTADADLAHWPEAVLQVKKRYGAAELVVPGHGQPGGLELLDHTVSLLQRHAAE